MTDINVKNAVTSARNICDSIYPTYTFANLKMSFTQWHSDAQQNREGTILSCWLINLWPSDAIWQHRSLSTLALVMACCLMTPNHYLNQCVDSSSMGFYNTHLRLNTLVRLIAYFPWATELTITSFHVLLDTAITNIVSNFQRNCIHSHLSLQQ